MITRSHLLTATLFALLLAGLACQTARRPVALLPPAQANAPAKTAAAPAQAPAVTKPAPAPAQPAKAAPKPDPVADLIAQVEKEYQAGQDNYKAGHLEAAKQNFDRAFNLLLGSNLDLRS